MIKLEICHVASGFLRDDARIFDRQCGSLVDKGYKVTLLVNDGHNDEYLNGVYIKSHSFTSKSRLFDIIFAKKYFIGSALEVNADVYHLHGPELIPLGIALKNRGKIVIYDAHEDLPRDILEKKAVPFLLRPLVSFASSLYLSYTLRKFDHILSVTPHIVDRLKGIAKNVTLITNFPRIGSYIDFTFSDYMSRDNVVCYSGTVYSYSNQENMINIVKSNSKVNYLVVGFMDLKFRENLLALKGNSTRINFLPRVSKNNLSLLFNKCTIGYVLYDYVMNLGFKVGSFGTNKLFEYMIAGLPIICTDFYLWKNIIDKYNCGIYVPPNNPALLESAVNFLIANKKIAYEMGQNGRRAIFNEFNWDIEQKKYLNIFSTIEYI